MNDLTRTTYLLRYLRAHPGENIASTAKAARERGLNFFIHNGRLFRTRAGYEEVGEVELA